MTRASAKTVVMAFVVLLALAVLGLMALTPADGSQPGSMGGHDMSGMSGHDMGEMGGMGDTGR